MSNVAYTPGYTANPEQVFVVTGFQPDSKSPGKAEEAQPCAHYVIAQNDFAATQVVVKRFADFVPMGCTNLKELKRFVVEMEAIRLGVLKPLGVAESAVVSA